MDTLKILVVDDESRMRKLVKDFLTKKNFQVLEAGNGEEAMDIFYEEKDIALIILDVMMPKMSVSPAAIRNSMMPPAMSPTRRPSRLRPKASPRGSDPHTARRSASIAHHALLRQGVVPFSADDRCRRHDDHQPAPTLSAISGMGRNPPQNPK